MHSCRATRLRHKERQRMLSEWKKVANIISQDAISNNYIDDT